MRHNGVLVGLAAASLLLGAAAPAGAHGRGGCEQLNVPAGQTVTVTATRTVCRLTLAAGGTLTAPDGKSVVLVVDGVQTATAADSTGGTRTVLQPGSWSGTVTLQVVDATRVDWSGLTFEQGQALSVVGGTLSGASATAAASGGKVTGSTARNVTVRSTGENFGGVAVSGGSYAVTGSTFRLTGNGRSDFIGSGAAIAATDGATVTVDGAKIDNTGVARLGVFVTGGSNVTVKNSTISTHDGVLPTGYQSTVDLAYMQQAPWMLGIVGNVRTTNLMGDGSTASYVGSTLSSTGWGVLSTDTGTGTRLTAINSTVRLTGDDGYGSYAIGGADEEFLGTRFDVADYVTIVRGGTVHYGDSDRSAVAAVVAERSIALSSTEQRRLREQATVATSDRFGVMFHGEGTVTIDGATRLSTGKTTFLDKGQEVDLTVDGSQGARVTSDNGVLFQLMDDDDPGPVMVDGKLVNAGVYTEPTSAPTRSAAWDVTAVHDEDAVATFRSISLKGDLYNAIRGGSEGSQGKNLVVTLDGARLDGVISASTSRHATSTITAADYEQIGEVTNTSGPAVNNGVVVTLANASTWKVTGTSYLTSLTVGAGSTLSAGRGKAVTMTVDGVLTPVVAGTTYTGAIVLSAA